MAVPAKIHIAIAAKLLGWPIGRIYTTLRKADPNVGYVTNIDRKWVEDRRRQPITNEDFAAASRDA